MNYFKNVILAPLSWLYATIVWIRNVLYNEHLLPSHSVKIPTICVGNLAVGGTGKTPFVEYLIRLLSPHYKIAVLSRGYGRSTRGFIVADGSSTAATIGDEPMQIHSKFPEIPVIACAERCEAIRKIGKIFPDVQVIILDDAYQHRHLKCGYYILLTAADRLYVHDHYLPWGRLRDSRDQYLRANMVVVTKCSRQMMPIDRRIIENALHLPSFQHLHFSSIHYPTFQTNENPCLDRVLVVSGIAHPDNLMEYILRQYPNATLLDYPDHHRYTTSDLAKIIMTSDGCTHIFTTEKDMTRLALLNLPEDFIQRLIPIPIEVMIFDSDDFDRQILGYVRENVRK